MAGAKGRSGRMPKEFVMRAQFIAERAKLLEVLEGISTGKVVDDPQALSVRLAASKTLLAYAHGNPAQTVNTNLTVRDPLKIVVSRE